MSKRLYLWKGLLNSHQGGDGIIIPEGVQEKTACAISDMAVISQRLDLMIPEVYSNIRFCGSVAAGLWLPAVLGSETPRSLQQQPGNVTLPNLLCGMKAM